MRRFLSGILYLIVGLPLALSALLSFSAKPILTDKEFYRKALTDDRLYSIVADPESWKNADPITERGGYRMDTAALVSAFGKNLPAAELKALASIAVDETFEALSANSSDRSIDLDLKPMKARLASSLPSISKGYAAALPVRDEPSTDADLSYRPASLPLAQAEKAAGSAFAKILLDIPETISESVGNAGLPASGRVRLLRFDPRSTGSTTTGLSLAAFALIAALSMLGSRTWTQRLRRAGKYIIIPSAIVMIAGGILYLPGAPALKAILPGDVALIANSANVATLSAYFASIFGPLARSLLLTGLVGSSIGGALVSSRRILEAREE